jgi:hypothetical protein
MPKFTKAHREALSKAAKARYAKKGKKRGRKPGVKVGLYKKHKPSKAYLESLAESLPQYDPKLPYTPAPLSLCGQLEDAILLFENRISNAIAKINSLM